MKPTFRKAASACAFFALAASAFFARAATAPTAILTPDAGGAIGSEEFVEQLGNASVMKEDLADQSERSASKPSSELAHAYNKKKRFIPKRLIAEKAGINAPVVTVGLRKDGKMDVPANYTEIGLYSFTGSVIGEKGTVVAGAHVDNGGTIAGVFKKLKYLKPGDIIIAKGENSDLRYRVEKVKIFSGEEKDTSEVFGNDGKSHLNLITCHGKWLADRNTYSHRIVVFSVLVP